MIGLRYILMLIGVVVTSCFFFPFQLSVLPAANSKMILAEVGLIMLGIQLFNHRDAQIDNGFLRLTAWSFVISFIAFMSTIINNTRDYTFASYFMSMWVWLGAAYAAVEMIKKIHGRISVELIVNYLLAVCVAQCCLALVFDSFTGAQFWHDKWFGEAAAYMGGTEDRLHGIGCALDVAGFRFAAVLIMTSFIIMRRSLGDGSTKQLIGYTLAILFIAVVGNMISRSTLIGLVIGVAYIILMIIKERRNRQRLGPIFFTSIIIAIPVIGGLYNNNEQFKDNFHFGFEGFFSIAETGEWETHSNNILKSMVVWPDNVETWLIGDGYLNNPLDKSLDSYDPYYTGPSFGGYYMQTDIGYCRYIFYFGIFGLAAFIIFFIQNYLICSKRFPAYSFMFLLLVTLNFIEWCKVSTDIFLVFAPFLCISGKEEEEGNYIEAKKAPEDTSTILS